MRCPASAGARYRIEEGDGPATAVRAEGWSLANEHVQVDVDPHDGTLAIAVDGLRVEGANRYVDGGDGGDTYNYSPPADDRIVDRPDVGAGRSARTRARCARACS